MKIIGTIKVIKDTEVISEKFQKRSLVVVTQDEYPQTLEIQFSQAKCALLDNFGEGELVECAINIRGREWTSPNGEVKYFTSLDGWQINLAGAGTGAAGPSSFTHHDYGKVQEKRGGNIERSFTEARLEAEQNEIEEEDDLPF